MVRCGLLWNTFGRRRFCSDTYQEMIIRCGMTRGQPKSTERQTQVTTLILKDIGNLKASGMKNKDFNTRAQALPRGQLFWDAVVTSQKLEFIKQIPNLIYNFLPVEQMSPEADLASADKSTLLRAKEAAIDFIANHIKPEMNDEEALSAVSLPWAEYVDSRDPASAQALFQTRIPVKPLDFEDGENANGAEVEIVRYSAGNKKLRHGIKWKDPHGNSHEIKNFVLPDSVATEDAENRRFIFL
jgi:hypothetical protein